MTCCVCACVRVCVCLGPPPQGYNLCCWHYLSVWNTSHSADICEVSPPYGASCGASGNCGWPAVWSKLYTAPGREKQKEVEVQLFDYFKVQFVGKIKNKDWEANFNCLKKVWNSCRAKKRRHWKQYFTEWKYCAARLLSYLKCFILRRLAEMKREGSSLPLGTACGPSCCSGGGGGCAGRGAEQRTCYSVHRCKVFLQCGGPGAPSGPASGRRSSHSEDRKMGAHHDDSSRNESKCI